MKIKRTVKMQLGDLIKKAVDEKWNSVGNVSEDGVEVNFDRFGRFNITGGMIRVDSTFNIQTEEEITVDTKFDTLIGITEVGSVFKVDDASIKNLKTFGSKLFYALIDGRLQLIWERDDSE